MFNLFAFLVKEKTGLFETDQISYWAWPLKLISQRDDEANIVKF